MFLDWLFNTYFFSAGVLVFAKPCGIVEEGKSQRIVEEGKSQGKSQVYAHVHNLLSNKVAKHIVRLKCIVYKWMFIKKI